MAPASLPGKVYTSGRGLQPNGIRVNETVDFRVHTEKAGDGAVVAKIIGPGGAPVRALSAKLGWDSTLFENAFTIANDRLFENHMVNPF